LEKSNRIDVRRRDQLWKRRKETGNTYKVQLGDVGGFSLGKRQVERKAAAAT
jgi:hypothetical protein